MPVANSSDMLRVSFGGIRWLDGRGHPLNSPSKCTVSAQTAAGARRVAEATPDLGEARLGIICCLLRRPFSCSTPTGFTASSRPGQGFRPWALEKAPRLTESGVVHAWHVAVMACQSKGRTKTALPCPWKGECPLVKRRRLLGQHPAWSVARRGARLSVEAQKRQRSGTDE